MGVGGGGLPVYEDHQGEDEEAVGDEDGEEDTAHRLLPVVK